MYQFTIWRKVSVAPYFGLIFNTDVLIQGTCQISNLLPVAKEITHARSTAEATNTESFWTELGQLMRVRY